MSDSIAVVWDDSLLGYTMGGDHPLHPVRLDLTMRLADGLGVLARDRIEVIKPTPADVDLLTLVHVGEVQADHVHEQALGQPVLAHDGRGQLATLVRELQVPVALDREQPVALHPGHRLTHRGAALVQPFGDTGAQRRHALLLEFEDRAQVHLGSVNEVGH